MITSDLTGIPVTGKKIQTGKEAENLGKIRKLQKVSEQFEALLVGNMLKAMRETVPEGGLFKRGVEMDIFQGIFDDEISSRVASRHQIGFADLIFKQLSGKLNLGVPIEEILKQANEAKIKAKELQKPMEPNFLPGQAKTGQSIQSIIEKAAKNYDIDPHLIKAVIKHESNGDPMAVSAKGAKGLMQLMDSTANMLGVEDPFNPEENIMGGAKYLKDLLLQFDNDIELALASYNAGPGAVQKYGGIPPFSETRNYVKKVVRTYHSLKSI